MLNWVPATESKPSQGQRVLLKIRHEDCPVVGYWGAGEWEACSVNHGVSCAQYCYGGTPEANFKSSEVTHYAEIGDLPEDEQ